MEETNYLLNVQEDIIAGSFPETPLFCIKLEPVQALVANFPTSVILLFYGCYANNSENNNNKDLV